MIPPKSTDDPAWLVMARKDIGIREGRDDAKILAYRQFTKERPWAKTTGVGSAWCSDALNAWMERSHVTGTRSAAASSWKRWGRPSEIVPGAVVVFGPHDPDAAVTGHCGLVNKLPADGWVEILSANQRNRVTLKNYLVADIVACRWPTFP